MKPIYFFGNRHLNLSHAAQKSGFSEQTRLIHVHQVHSDIHHNALDILDACSPPQGDALYLIKEELLKLNADKDFVLAVQTADCVPVLFFINDKQGNLLAIGAIHSGWKGTVNQIVTKTLEHCLRLTNATALEAHAFLGPAISANQYEVGEDFLNEFVKSGLSEFVFPHPSRANKWLADNRAAVKSQLLSMGVPESQIHLNESCTYNNADEFASYRREGAKRGRQWSIIGIKK